MMCRWFWKRRRAEGKPGSDGFCECRKTMALISASAMLRFPVIALSLGPISLRDVAAAAELGELMSDVAFSPSSSNQRLKLDQRAPPQSRGRAVASA